MINGVAMIEDAFSSAREVGARVLIGFLTSGDPSPKHSLRLAESLIRGGVDIIELGIPFSDPVADGPSIQAANARALGAKTTPQTTLRIVRDLNKGEPERKVPILLLSYLNPILRFGTREFLGSASDSGVSGLVIPDLPLEANESISSLTRKNRIAAVRIAAPTTPNPRLESLISRTEGFLYLVSLLGVTGSRKSNQKLSPSSLKFIKSACSLARKRSKNTAVGFGISGPEQVKDVLRSGADGVIVGSFFVNLVASGLDDIDHACKLLTKSARRLKEATRGF